jgi:hypothetical protein|eukprot:COSAG02_NODE_1443_length_12584_cov_2.587425_9_plen_96_part_00
MTSDAGTLCARQPRVGDRTNDVLQNAKVYNVVNLLHSKFYLQFCTEVAWRQHLRNQDRDVVQLAAPIIPVPSLRDGKPRSAQPQNELDCQGNRMR